MALSQASHPALKRYKFFISRRREEGRERFRMHLGFFASQAEAEGLLEVVREFYPAAWAGVAPGQKLRAAAAAAAAMDAVAAATPFTDEGTASMPALASAGLDHAPEAVVELSLVNDGIERSLPPQSLLELEAPLPPASTADARDSEDDRDTSEAMNSVRAAISSLEDTSVRTPTINPIPVLTTSDSGSMPSLSDSQVLRVLEPGKNPPTLGAAPPASMGAAMGKAAPQVSVKPVPPMIPGPVAKSSPVAGPAPRAPAAPARSALPAPVANAAAPVARAPASAPARTAAPSGAAAAPATAHAPSATVVMPGLAQVSNRPTSATTPEAAAAAAAALGTGAPQAQPAAYAVQLIWSVQPIDMASVPQLAIFAAYTLYAAEGNRDGRRWFGLRLGFFTDPVSARQVAQYVRSEFKSVSVVPVTARETERAAKMPRPAAAAAPAAPVDAAAIEGATAAKSNDEFRLLETGSRPKLPDPKTVSGKAAPGKRAKARMPPPKSGETDKNLKKRRAPLTLEETLEILGAGELQVAENRVELLSDSGVRHLSQQAIKARKGKESRFSRLMDRLSERK
jgi:hypothetical protein